jgi:hypothetical protein
MSQNLFAPPNVKGWPGGDAWINSSTLLARKQFLDRLARNDAGPPSPREMRTPEITPVVDASPPGDEGLFTRRVTDTAMAEDASTRALRIARQIDRSTRPLRFDAVQWFARREGHTRAEKLSSAKRLLLPIAPQLAVPDDVDITTALHAALLDPSYQLK